MLNINPKILFIIKERSVYGTKSACYGLVNSCQFVANELKRHGVHAKVVQVVDNNGIDKIVSQYKPTHCFIEALWVVPSKFKELAKLHRHIKWIVRIHSMVPFLVSEGMSFDWLNEYTKLAEEGIKLSISCNNYKLYKDLVTIYPALSFTPNIYKLDERYNEPSTVEESAWQEARKIIEEIFIGFSSKVKKEKHIVNIGCFGALRLLKNHCQQALWAIRFANELGKVLHFHVNVSNHETNETSPVLKNLKGIFKNTKHKLVEHTWMPHDDFLALVKHMDFGLQLSFTETFNVVAADFAFSKVPIVVSEEIDFISKKTTVDVSNPDKVIEAMKLCYDKSEASKLIKRNLYLLEEQNSQATKQWLKTLQEI